jgi:WXG100 family type VII secretion target
MPLPTLRATPEDLDVASKKAMDIAGALEGLRSRTMTQANTVIATWCGTAPPAFTQQMSTWHTAMTNLINELTRVGNAAKQSADHQRNADQTSTAAVNNVQPAAVLKPF